MQALIEILKYAEKIYEENSHPNQRYYKLCLRFAKLTDMTLKVIIGAYVVTALLLIAPTVYEYLATGHLTPSMHAYFVGVTDYSDYLEELLNIYNHSAVVVVMFTFVAPDILIYITFINIPLISSVFEGEVQLFEDELQKQDEERRAYDIRANQIRIIRLYTDYIE